MNAHEVERLLDVIEARQDAANLSTTSGGCETSWE